MQRGELEPSQLGNYPLLDKEHVIHNLNKIVTISEKKGIVSKTGGTTGASMKVIYTKSDLQERFAILDDFRSRYGYTLGKKTAWFSGKSLLGPKDLEKGICYRDDFINKIRFFSTFHVNEANFDIYWQALVNFKPEFIVGFPSSVFDICTIAKSRGLRLDFDIKVMFPTAETVLGIHRDIFLEILGCKTVDQYSASEGAPFILECESGNLHFHPLTGIVEVLDQNLQPSRKGELVVTSFTTHGTPLVRYRIGDFMVWGDTESYCNCGSIFPIVESLEGRTTDCIWSEENGRVNQGNLSNCTKGVDGIVTFQIVQNLPNKIDVFLVTTSRYNERSKNVFLNNLYERVGQKMQIELHIVDNIPREKSGKFRFLKNCL